MKQTKKVAASVTVEAALIMPIFMFVMVGFLFFFQIFKLQEDIQESITRVSKVASQYGYVYEYLQNSSEEAEDTKESKDHSAAKRVIQGFFDGTLFKTKFLEYMGENQNDNCIVGGLNGISFLESSFMKNDKDIEVVAIYTVRIPVIFFHQKPFTVVQRVHSRAFVGESLLEEANGNEDGLTEDEEYVYVTRTGTKYHKDYHCTYLNVKLTKVSGKDLADKRNRGGAKYYPCESCMSGKCKESGTYYITKYGTRYHSSSKCNKIERDIRKIKQSEAGSRTPCSKCGK